MDTVGKEMESTYQIPAQEQAAAEAANSQFQAADLFPRLTTVRPISSCHPSPSLTKEPPIYIPDTGTGTAGSGGSNPVAGFAIAIPTLAVATPGTATYHKMDTRSGAEPHVPSAVAVPNCGWGRALPSATSNQARMARAS